MATGFHSWARNIFLALSVLGKLANAEDEVQPSTSLLETLTGARLTELPGLSDVGVTLGGWLSLGVTYNSNNPGDHSNLPVTFNDRSSEFQLNQFYLYLERAVNKESRRWDIGGRFDFVFGTDSRFTQAAGSWDQNLIGDSVMRFYKIALPQAYAEIATPFVRGATIKVGHFYTILGQEVVPAPNNFFYSHSYSMQYGEPFTHTGLLATYPVTTNLTVNMGAVLGPYGKHDNFSEQGSNWNFLGGATWMSDDGGTSVAASVTSGPTGDKGNPNRTIGSVVFNHDFTDKLHYIAQYDHGFQAQAVSGKDATWYGINQYWIYSITDTVSTGLRYEWFRDQSGFRVLGIPASYYEVSAGVNWKPMEWLLLRAETRYDWADANKQVFDSGTRGSQLTLGFNGVVRF